MNRTSQKLGAGETAPKRRISGLALVLTLMLTGCAGMREAPQFTMRLDAEANTTNLVFPPASDGEVPRYLYLGELRGEANLVRPKDPTAGVKQAIAWLADVAFGEAAPLGLDRPQSGISDGQGRVYVTDIGRGGVFVFDEVKAEVALWNKADGLADFISPVGIAWGPDGQVLVADAELGLVARLDVDGNPLGSFGRDELERPNGVAYDPEQGRIYVADTSVHQVKIFDRDGTFLTELGERGDGDGEFNFPTHLTVRHGKLYVSDTMNARIQVFSTKSGKHLQTVGKRGMFIGNFTRPKGVAVDAEENIYAVESYFDYLLVYSRRGEFLMPLGGQGFGLGKFHLPSGVWVDVRNRIYVADMLNSRVAVFQFLGGESE